MECKNLPKIGRTTQMRMMQLMPILEPLSGGCQGKAALRFAGPPASGATPRRRGEKEKEEPSTQAVRGLQEWGAAAAAAVDVAAVAVAVDVAAAVAAGGSAERPSGAEKRSLQLPEAHAFAAAAAPASAGWPFGSPFFAPTSTSLNRGNPRKHKGRAIRPMFFQRKQKKTAGEEEERSDPGRLGDIDARKTDASGVSLAFRPRKER